MIAEEFLKKRTSQKDNLVITRGEALSGLKAYAKLKCDEQRKLCAQACYGDITDQQWESIENAPTPDF